MDHIKELPDDDAVIQELVNRATTSRTTRACPPQQWGRELWLCCWMTGALHDYMTVCREAFDIATYVKAGGWGREFFLCCWMTGCWFNQFIRGYQEAGYR
jgi:hypothetical protein